MPADLRWRAVYFFATVIAPWISFLGFANTKFGGAEWQDGNFSTYFLLAFSDQVWILFIPFLLYSSIAMLLLLLNPSRFAPNWLVRFGIYTGTILAIHFTLQLIPSQNIIVFMLGIITLIAVPLLTAIFTLLLPLAYIFWIHQSGDKQRPLIVAGSLLLGAILLFLFGGNAVSLLFTAPIGLLCAGITLCAPLAIWTTVCLWRNAQTPVQRSSLLHGLGLGWLLGYMAAWYVAINRIFDLYDQLPTSPPNCYIATASAHGHPLLVKPIASWESANAVGIVSRQLQILKAGELVLQATMPASHGRLRKVYDLVGQWLAQRIRNQWVASCSYLLLKPFEWATFIFLRLFLAKQLPAIYRFYRVVK